MIPEEIKMELKEFFFANWKMILAILLTLIAMGSLLFLPKDNEIEELMEREIESITGVHIDFTPENPLKSSLNQSPKGVNGSNGTM